ncbi:hypothetical protein QJ857_gp0953 [Tupanvirus soda lake]|uniref:MYND-type domain-containing protein n=2 Tax=Tupanvirus TaxID=2094720 RepID=A0A6N1P244_9VIRU|nr:hypothetical protein QJ857_gp0953 [Tupanvirus soda lake]QKU35101.1 hypothetical protein [Tupanvirus soda lake]
MITIAVIEKNNCTFDKMEEHAACLLYAEHGEEERKKIKQNINNYIWSVIEPYVKFVDVDEKDFLGTICDHLTNCFPGRKIDEEFFYHTEGSYSFPKKYIEFIHCQPLWKDYKDSQIENMNNLACLMSLKHNVIENTCVVFSNKYDLSAPHFTALESITKEDILRIVRRRFYFSAILIKDDQLVKYYYQNPSYLISKIYGLTEKENIQKLSQSILKYNLAFYFQHDKSKYVNKIATRINGLYRLHGDVIMLHEMEENVFANLSIHEAKRLNVLSYGRLYDRELKKEEIHTIDTVEVDDKGKQVEKKVTPLWSRYIVVNHRMLQWQEKKNKCINCYGEMKTPIVCDKCYRVKYCSYVCQKEFSSYHTDECINPKSY